MCFNLVRPNILLLLLLSILLSVPALAADRVQVNTSTPTWLYKTHPDPSRVPSTRDISEGYYLELLDHQVHVPTNSEYVHFIRHIVNQSGVQNGSEVSVTFSPSFQQVVFHRVNIIRDGKPIDQLHRDDIKVISEEDEAGEFTYNGRKRAYMNLKDVRKGDRIEVSYSIVGANPVFANRYSGEIFFPVTSPISNYYYTIITTPGRRLHIKAFNNAPLPKELGEGNNYIYSWTIEALKPDSAEDSGNTPSWYDRDPKITVTEYGNWQEVIRWGLDVFHHYSYDLPAELRTKISAWKRTAAGDKDLFANLASRFVQDDIRYLALEIGANTHKPHDPSEVFSHRFGDCKDKALLLAMILRSEKIPAYVALISTDTRNKLNTVQPGPLEFDHVVVAIERAAHQYTYVDATISGQRGELKNLYLPPYGYAMVLQDGLDSLQLVAPVTNYKYSVEDSLRVRFDGPSQFKVASLYKGGAADNMRSSLEEVSMKDMEENFRKYYGSIFSGIKVEEPVSFRDDSLKDELLFNESYTIPNIWQKSEKGKRSFDFTVQMLNNLLPDPADQPANAPLSLSYPRTVDYALTIVMPEHWNWSGGAVHIRNDSYQFDFTPTVQGRVIGLKYYFQTFRDHIPPAELAQYKSDYKTMMPLVGFELYKDLAAEEEFTYPVPDADPAPSVKSSPPGRPATAPSTHGDLDWIAVWFTFFYAVFFTWLVRRLNAGSDETFYSPGTGYPLQGWILLIGIGQVMALVGYLAYFMRTGFLQNIYMGEPSADWRVRTYRLLALLFVLFEFSGKVAVLNWWARRRDIYPRMFIWYTGLRLLGLSLVTIMAGLAPMTATADIYDSIGRLAFLAGYAAITITYIRRSDRVKRTFIEPY